jgi:predicted DNA-binding transcriptional regulator YafY
MTMATVYSDTRERILALERIIQKVRRMTVPHMIDELYRSYGIVARRQTIERDIDALTAFLPIEEEDSYGTTYYRLVSDEEMRSRYREE